MDGYRADLALIHDAGFGRFAEGAGEMLVGELRRRGLADGTVVDLGCGSGITARRVADAGYAVVGLDLSPSMIEIARGRVPEGRFEARPFVGAELPRCVAVCAIGEVLNYAFDEESDDAARAALFAGAFAALAPGGLLLLDVAGPGRAPAEPTRTWFEDDGWAVLTEVRGEDDGLVREITVFRRDGEAFRRDRETHRLRLVPPERIEEELRAAGFHVERTDRYGDVPLPPGLHGFVARKPVTPGLLASDRHVAYAEMAADGSRESEARTWADALIGDVAREIR